MTESASGDVTEIIYDLLTEGRVRPLAGRDSFEIRGRDNRRVVSRDTAEGFEPAILGRDGQYIVGMGGGKILYATDEPVANVFDDAPFLPEGMPRDGFPYIVIGEQNAEAWDTDDTLGADVDATLHVWSRSGGSAETRDILGRVYRILHRVVVQRTGVHVVDVKRQYENVLMDPDGETRHGVAGYTVTIQEA